MMNYGAGEAVDLSAAARQAGCGLVFQFPERHFLGSSLVTELFIGAPPGATPVAAAARSQFTARLPMVLHAVGMTDMRLDRDPSTLSDGYKRRLALAVQLLRKPDLLLLDEPLAGAPQSLCVVSNGRGMVKRMARQPCCCSTSRSLVRIKCHALYSAIGA
jgi:energy-coupling factor transporter ATP-binding protein EcfA2